MRLLVALEDEEGAGNAGCRPHPWPACNKKSRRQSPQVQPDHPAFPAQWFYGLYRALPGDRAFLPPSSRRISPAQLSASVGAPGPHDFAVRFRRRSSCVAKASTASRPNVRDDRETPLLVRRDDSLLFLFLPSRQVNFRNSEI